MVANHGPDSLGDTRVIEAPSSALVSVRPSQGTCSIGTLATCDLGNLAPGSAALVVVTTRPAGEGSFISTAIANADAADGSERETSALTTTRGVNHSPGLALRRPVDPATTFWIGRNNTVQWTLRGVAGGVRIELSRDDGATWTRLSDEAENVGFYDWTGAGDVSPRARIRVTSLRRPELTQTSPSFAIARR
jgi:hypothetical protein